MERDTRSESETPQLVERLSAVAARGRRVGARALAHTSVHVSGGAHEAMAHVLDTLSPSPQAMIRAYASGAYLTDWGGRFAWNCPPQRGVSPLDDFHLPKHARRLLRKGHLEVRVDFEFEAVLEACANAPRQLSTGTWLSERLQQNYLELHAQGVAHSVGVYDDGRLVAGLFGMGIGGAFSSESSFTTVSNASKVAYASLHFGLRDAGFELLDIQEVSSMTKAFGGHFLERDDFLERLASAVVLRPEFPSTEAMTAATKIGVGL